MTRPIDADEMLKRLESWNTDDDMDKALYNFTLNRIIEQPTVDAEPVRHGKWDYVTVVDEGFWRCSNCGTPSEALGARKLYKYCPFCGAKMGEDNETD